ncbi:MAG: hypothetical protein IIA72_18585 [Proteobacteria bacterium]|nr:hypothetical protein [Pseudomonadota bacterium]
MKIFDLDFLSQLEYNKRMTIGKTNKNWMRELSKHCRAMRAQFREEKLLVLFDVYGTILDARFYTVNVLKGYDRKFDTKYFGDLEPSDINASDINKTLKFLRILSESEKEKIINKCKADGCPPAHSATAFR